MKKLTIFIFFVYNSYCLSNNKQFISFDWGDQLGYVNENGMVMWGKDWESNNLFFDGSWAIFPSMFGENIEENFQSNSKSDVDTNSFETNSEINYVQGDYGYDKFSFLIDYIDKNKNLQLHGFKRSYFGNYNQYYANTLQPQQQSYTLAINSDKVNQSTALTIGHFNTYSGLPDSITNGLFDNRITLLNYFYETILRNISIRISTDQFLQRFKTNHSLSLYNSSRYLNRSLYEVEFSYLKLRIPVAVGFKRNNRVTVLESTVDIDWASAYSKFELRDFKFYNHAIKYADKIFYDYDLIFNKTFKSISIFLLNETKHFLVHPYYIHNYNTLNKNKFYKTFCHRGHIEWEGLNSKVNLEMSYTRDHQKLGIEVLGMKNQYNNMIFTVFRKITSNVDASFCYRKMDTKNYYSGGIGNHVEFKIKSKFSLFNNFMKMQLDADIKHLYNRVNYSMINPIEMVPMIKSKNDHRTLPPISLLNVTARANVSTVVFEFQWKNLSEIILSSMQSEQNNLILLHPDLPPLGRQINFSIKWKFQD